MQDNYLLSPQSTNNFAQETNYSKLAMEPTYLTKSNIQLNTNIYIENEK